MILISGVPCSGKTTLINSDCIHKKVTKNCWRQTLNANTIRENTPNHPLSLSTVVHYDSLRPFKRNLDGYSISSDPFLQYLHNQSNIDIITVLAPLNTLMIRLQNRKKRLINNAISKSRLEKIERVIDLYQDSTKFMEIFHEWLVFCDSLQTVSHHLYLNTDKTELTKPVSAVNHDELLRFLLKSV
jgi:hypothetical protein